MQNTSEPVYVDRVSVSFTGINTLIKAFTDIALDSAANDPTKDAVNAIDWEGVTKIIKEQCGINIVFDKSALSSFKKKNFETFAQYELATKEDVIRASLDDGTIMADKKAKNTKHKYYARIMVNLNFSPNALTEQPEAFACLYYIRIFSQDSDNYLFSNNFSIIEGMDGVPVSGGHFGEFLNKFNKELLTTVKKYALDTKFGEKTADYTDVPWE